MNIPSVAELHRQHPHDWEKHSWSDAWGTFEDALSTAGELHLQEDPVAYLEAIHENDQRRSTLIHRALLYLPPEVVYDYFGQEVAAWLSLRSFIDRDNDAINSVLCDKGLNTDDLKIARLWTWHHYPHDATIRRELGLYGLMQSMKNGLTDAIDLSAVLNECASPGVELSAKRLGDYALQAIRPDQYNSWYSGGWVSNWTDNKESSVHYPVWLDGPTGFALTYKDAPQAVGALSMSSEKDVMIHQIQGVKGKRIDPTKMYFEKGYYSADISTRGLAPLDWRKAVVRIAEWIGRQQGAERIAIEAGAHNGWTKKRSNDKEPHLTVAEAERVYDATARRLGYQRAEHDDWYKVL
jgi:hypothetical protein